MRYLLFFLPFVLAAQSAESDQRVTQTLISEIRELRQAIERSTLLNARTQLAISQLQLQETAVVRLTSQLNEVRAQAPGIDRRTRLRHRRADRINRSADHGRLIAKAERSKLRELKVELDQATAMEAASRGPRGRAARCSSSRPRTRSPTRAPASPRWSARSTPPSNS